MKKKYYVRPAATVHDGMADLSPLCQSPPGSEVTRVLISMEDSIGVGGDASSAAAKQSSWTMDGEEEEWREELEGENDVWSR